MEEAAKLADAVKQQEVRRKYLGYRPGQLGKVRGVEAVYEFRSFAFAADDGSGVYVMAQVIGDPATYRAFKVRREIALIGWGHGRQRMFRQGWLAGQAYLRYMQEEEYRKQRNDGKGVIPKA